jgi:hypothetical protein
MVWLANCCFARISLGFPFLPRFCDEQSGYSFYPFPCYPGPLARSWRRPFHSCGVPYPQAPTLDHDSLTATIAEFMHVGPHPRRLNGTLGTSHSSAPFRNRSEAFDTAWPSQSLEQAKVPRAVLPESPTEARPERSERRTHSCGRRNEATESQLGCPRIAQQIALAFHIQIEKDVVRPSLPAGTALRWSFLLTGSKNVWSSHSCTENKGLRGAAGPLLLHGFHEVSRAAGP